MTPAVAAHRAGSPSPVAGLHACLDSLALLDPSALDASAQAALLGEVARAESRLTALRLRVLAAADATQTAAVTGAASTGQWAARVANADPVTAARQVGLATGLARRTATQQALGAGAISPEHAAVIVQADRHLPDRVTRDQREEVEAMLISKAQVLAPSALRRAARRALEAVEPDPQVVDAHENALVASEEVVARSRTRLSLHDNQDGTVTGHFTIPAAQGELLRKIIQTITAPRRGRLGASPAQVGEREERSDWDRARGLALCELIEHLPTDHLHPRTAATLVVTVSEETLRGALQIAGLDTGGVVSAGEARRLACGAALAPAVLGTRSQVLDLGRTTRLFSDPQRTAVGINHQHCAATGCERPFAWCELHHRDPWSFGGRTDLRDAVPLCQFHHQRIHDPQYEHQDEADGSISFRRRV